MAKAPVVEEGQFRHAIKVAAVTGQTPARDAALLCVLYGTGMTATELAQLEVADLLDEGGGYRRESLMRPAPSTASPGRSTGRTPGFVRRWMPTLQSASGLGMVSPPGAHSGAAWRTWGRSS